MSYRSSPAFAPNTTVALDDRLRVTVDRNRWTGEARCDGQILWRPSVGAAVDAILAVTGMPTEGIVFEVRQ